ncbi:hypothetical protein FISHEDRAFT_61760 [Fistulina hepatica ATCC 64428]|uniref:Uncharacterized protein n=1 Tax=Fistulina hepatica ATCC 64428 TaxID=1128425 RepID=A0A0D7A2X9_9AGAR|nr:hypothetical protein FISHEDRAFT_61760 [Fistulina hepatica ATCC 64428]
MCSSEKRRTFNFLFLREQVDNNCKFMISDEKKFILLTASLTVVYRHITTSSSSLLPLQAIFDTDTINFDDIEAWTRCVKPGREDAEAHTMFRNLFPRRCAKDFAVVNYISHCLQDESGIYFQPSSEGVQVAVWLLSERTLPGQACSATKVQEKNGDWWLRHFGTSAVGWAHFCRRKRNIAGSRASILGSTRMTAPFSCTWRLNKALYRHDGLTVDPTRMTVPDLVSKALISCKQTKLDDGQLSLEVCDVVRFTAHRDDVDLSFAGSRFPITTAWLSAYRRSEVGSTRGG